MGRPISGDDHLSCNFGLRLSHLALKRKSGQGKVGFRWGAVTGTFHVNCSPLEGKHKNSIHIDFIASNGGVTTYFPRVYLPTHLTFEYIHAHSSCVNTQYAFALLILIQSHAVYASHLKMMNACLYICNISLPIYIYIYIYEYCLP